MREAFKATSSISETGTNTLFLLLGFLEYQDSADSEITYQAPLVSIPVTIEKKTFHGQIKYYVTSNGDDIQENLSLREKMKRDFSIVMPVFDEESFEIKKYLENVERATRRQTSFKINRIAALGFLSFKGMLMIKDLEPENWAGRNGNELLDHPIVRKLFGEMDSTEQPTNIFGESEDFYDVDSEENAKLPLVYDADQSQHSALIDILHKKKDLVIQGPPGTGKSQTITNIIAGAIDKGLTVLFVAEKLAALEVVKHRLDSVGLEPMLLELHSDKANKKTVLESLSRRRDYMFTDSHALDGDLNSLHNSIKELNRYSKMMGAMIQEALNLTVYSTLWRTIRLRESGLENKVLEVEYHVSDADSLTIDVFDERMDFLVEIKEALDALGTEPDKHPFEGFQPNTPSPIYLEELKNTLRVFLGRVTPFSNSLTTYESYWKGNYGPKITSLPESVELLESWITDTREFGHETLINGISSAKYQDGDFKHLIDNVSELATSIEEYERLRSVYSIVLSQPDLIQAEDESLLLAVMKVMEEAGVLVSVEDLPEFIAKLRSVATDTLQTHASLLEVLKPYGQEFDGTYNHLRYWINLGNCLSKAPIADFNHNSALLFKTAAILGIRELKVLNETLFKLRAELEANFYFDQLPEQKELSASIRTLRAGTEWYRVINTEYRAALRLHRSLDKNKRTLDGSARLKELEQLAQLFELQQRWGEHPAWTEYIGSKPSMDLDFDKVLTVAEWICSLALTVRLRIEDVDREWLNRVLAMVADDRLQEVKEHFDRLRLRSQEIVTLLPVIGEGVHSMTLPDIAQKYLEVADSLSTVLPFVELQTNGKGSFREIRENVELVLRARKLRTTLAERTDFAWMAGNYKGVETDIAFIFQAIAYLNQLAESKLSKELKAQVLTDEPLRSAEAVKQILSKTIQFRELVLEFQNEMSSLGKFSYKRWFRLPIEAKPVDVHKRFIEKVEAVLASIDSIYHWFQYVNLRSKAPDLFVLRFVEGLETRQLQSDRIADLYKYAVYNSLLSDFMDQNPTFIEMTGEKLSQLKQQLRNRDKQIISRRGHMIAKKRSRVDIADLGTDGTRVDDKTEVYLIKHLIGQTRPRVPLRKLLARAPKTIQALKPCFMMSPQSVVRFMQPNKIKFDLLVMDEASQLKPEEAISAITRAKQVVVVGDSKQLPPTNFFQTNQDDLLEEDDAGSVVTDVESILEIASRAFGHSRSLKVHYRSRHQSLVAFSNRHFYDNKLLLFPSPFEPNIRYGVRAVYMANAYFDSSLNPVEAAKVVDLIVDHVYHRTSESLGVVAVNLKQRDLIDELLDQRIQADQELASKIEQLHERLFIKNLENVQGDERDVMIVSTTYGPKPNTRVVAQRFGPIGYENGWRRLNVLFTRARNSMIVVTSLKPSDIKVDETSKMGVRTFHDYLEYVYNGTILPENTVVHEPESDFEESVIDLLRSAGYEVVPQLGVAGYRIDIAVKHPHYPGSYLAAIECDGASYHSSRSARERDRIRQEILEGLGWKGKIWRIWSTDWFFRAKEEKLKLLEFLKDRASELQEIYEPVRHWDVIGHEVTSNLSGTVHTGVEVVSESAVVSGIDSSLLGEDVDEIVVNIGDTITYVELEHPDSVKTATIVRGMSDTQLNHHRYDTPFAKAVLGCAEGDIAELTLMGHMNEKVKRFRILSIKPRSGN